MRPNALCSVAAALCLVAGSPARIPAQTLRFSDTSFQDTDWTVTAEGVNLGGSAARRHMSGGGPQGPWGEVTNTVTSAVGQPFANWVYAFHARTGAVCDPKLRGPIVSIDYSEQATGPVMWCGFAVRQGGTVYYGPGYYSSQFVVWGTTELNGMTAESFDALAPGIQRPDFSLAGAPIELGFFRASWTAVGGPGGTYVGGVDTWQVRVHHAQATPSRSTSWGRIKSLYR